MARKAATPSPSQVPPQLADPSHGRSTASSAPTHSPTKSKPNRSTTSTIQGSSNSIRSIQDAQKVIVSIWNKYLVETPQRTKLIDVFSAFLVLVGALQFMYCVIAGNYPFNAFLSGFSATVGQFVLTASLRMQTSTQNAVEFKTISHERAFADYVFGSLILHFFCINFIN